MSQAVEVERSALPADSLLAQIISETNITPQDEGYEEARLGIGAIVTMLAPTVAGEKVNKAVINHMIADIDRRLEAFTNLVLHSPEFQSLEATWRSIEVVPLVRTGFSDFLACLFPHHAAFKASWS